MKVRYFSKIFMALIAPLDSENARYTKSLFLLIALSFLPSHSLNPRGTRIFQHHIN